MRLAPCCSALAARAGTRQVEATLRADRAAAAVQRASLPIWRALLALAKGGQYSRQQAHRLAQSLPRILAGEVAKQSKVTAAWGWKTATATIRGSLPRAVLARAALRRNLRPLRLREAIDFTDPLAAFRDGTTPYTDADLADLLFPAPTQDLLDRVVFATGWADRLASGTGLGDPQVIADTISNGLAGGQSQQQIATALRPLVQGVVSSAKRVARTEGLRVASAVQMAAHSQLGDLVAGWQIHATLDERTRPEHAARNGTIYWIHPKAGQLGTDVMPHPPHEADGSLAHNCRCYLTPVLREPDEPGVFDPGVFDPEKLTPSPAVYSDWWAKADQRRRELAVGARRLATVQASEKSPEWEHFIDPETGSLLPVDTLKEESTADRASRLARGREATRRAREQIRAVSTTGTGRAP